MRSSLSANVLESRRATAIARSFYRQLEAEGFSPEQIIELSTALLDLVAIDIQGGAPAVAPR